MKTAANLNVCKKYKKNIVYCYLKTFFDTNIVNPKVVRFGLCVECETVHEN